MTKATPIIVLIGVKGQQVLYPIRFNLLACESGIAVLTVTKLKSIIIIAKTMVNAVTCIVSRLL